VYGQGTAVVNREQTELIRGAVSINEYTLVSDPLRPFTGASDLRRWCTDRDSAFREQITPRGLLSPSSPNPAQNKPGEWEMSSTQQRLNQVFRDLFEDDELEINRDTTAQDVEGWDSVQHVSLVIKVEKAFGVRFSSAEVAQLKNVGELLDMIDSKQNGQAPDRTSSRK
jgi:acyl carrier protein